MNGFPLIEMAAGDTPVGSTPTIRNPLSVRLFSQDFRIIENQVISDPLLAVDKLRYYEKIGLMPRIGRDNGGRRHYEPHDLVRLRFIQRAQRCNFRSTRSANRSN